MGVTHLPFSTHSAPTKTWKTRDSWKGWTCCQCCHRAKCIPSPRQIWEISKPSVDQSLQADNRYQSSGHCSLVVIAIVGCPPDISRNLRIFHDIPLRLPRVINRTSEKFDPTRCLRRQREVQQVRVGGGELDAQVARIPRKDMGDGFQGNFIHLSFGGKVMIPWCQLMEHL